MRDDDKLTELPAPQGAMRAAQSAIWALCQYAIGNTHLVCQCGRGCDSDPTPGVTAGYGLLLCCVRCCIINKLPHEFCDVCTKDFPGAPQSLGRDMPIRNTFPVSLTRPIEWYPDPTGASANVSSHKPEALGAQLLGPQTSPATPTT